MKTIPKRRGGARNTGMSLGGASGIAGLCLRWRNSKDGENVYPYACGSWVDAKGQQRSNSISIDRHGITEAVKLALAPRRQAGMPTPSDRKAANAVKRWMSASN